MLAPLSEYPDAPPMIYELAQQSLSLWPGIMDELDVPYALDGSVVVAHRQDYLLLDKFERTLKRAKVPGVQRLEKNGLESLEPQLAQQFHRGLFLKGEGWLDNRRLLDCLKSHCGTIHYEEQVVPAEIDGDVVVDCRGAYADDPELRAVRGEVLRIRAPEVDISRPVRLMHPKYQLYISPRDDHEYVIGATQLESESEAGVSVRSALELLSAAYTLHTGFAEAEILELSVGLRPAFPDNLPRVRWVDGVLQVNGLHRHGYLIAPATVQSALEEINSLCKLSSTATP